jgi:hypothetical protein
MRLRRVITAHFGQQEWKLFDAWKTTHSTLHLAADDLVLMVSMNGRVGYFISDAFVVQDEVPIWNSKTGKTRTYEKQVLPARKFRVRGGRMTIGMIGRAARELGFKIDNLDLFEEWFEERKQQDKLRRKGKRVKISMLRAA